MNQVLYRMYDAAGNLLYVGISVNVAQRFAAHRCEKNWWDDIASIRLEHFADRAAVAAAETEAIQTEQPRYNIKDAARQPVTAVDGATGSACERLMVASANRQTIEAEIEAARADERAAILAALDSGMRQVQVVAITGFTREYIRRMVKADREQQESTA